MYNCIRFGNTKYLQKKGTATGASVSVAYANIYAHAEVALTDKGPAKPKLEQKC